MTIRSFENHYPEINASAYVDEAAFISGKVSIGANSSIWPMSVLRGDVNYIRIGERTNIQDGSVLHVTHPNDFFAPDGFPLHIGNDVTVGHNAVLHACTIGDRCLIGMGAIILDGAIIESDVVIGAGSLVAPGKVIQSGALWLGSPARRVRDLKETERQHLLYSAKHYVELSARTQKPSNASH